MEKHFKRNGIPLDHISFRFICTLESRFNEVAADRPNLFVKWRVRYIETLDITNLRGNDQNVIFVTQKCPVLRCNSLSVVAFSINLYFHN